MKTRVVVDLVTLTPGRGGTGGGVWRYATSLIGELGLLDDDLQIVVVLSSRSSFRPAGVQVRLMPNFFASGIGRFVWVNFALWFFCLWQRAHVVHKVATEVPLIFPLIPIVVTVHDFMAEHELDRTRRTKSATRQSPALKHHYFALQAWLACKANGVIFPTKAIASEAVERYSIRPDSCHVVHNGVHSAQEVVNSDTNFSVPMKWLVVAAFSPHKGHLQVLNALRRLAEHGSNVPINVTFHGHVIDTNYFEDIKAACAKMPAGVELNIRSYRPESSTKSVYDGFDGLLLLSEYEGFGLPILEAQAAGLVVVASNIQVFVEVAGDSALLVDRDNAEEVVSAMLQLETSREMRILLRERGLDNVSRFSWTICAVRTAKIYARAAIDRRFNVSLGRRWVGRWSGGSRG